MDNVECVRRRGRGAGALEIQAFCKCFGIMVSVYEMGQNSNIKKYDFYPTGQTSLDDVRAIYLIFDGHHYTLCEGPLAGAFESCRSTHGLREREESALNRHRTPSNELRHDGWRGVRIGEASNPGPIRRRPTYRNKGGGDRSNDGGNMEDMLTNLLRDVLRKLLQTYGFLGDEQHQARQQGRSPGLSSSGIHKKKVEAKQHRKQMDLDGVQSAEGPLPPRAPTLASATRTNLESKKSVDSDGWTTVSRKAKVSNFDWEHYELRKADWAHPILRSDELEKEIEQQKHRSAGLRCTVCCDSEEDADMVAAMCEGEGDKDLTLIWFDKKGERWPKTDKSGKTSLQRALCRRLENGEPIKTRLARENCVL